MALTKIFHKEDRDREASWSKNPFKALDPYAEDESEKFYGRKDEIQNLYYHVKQNYLTVLYGESGVGKSSIINAGLVPLLRTKNILPVRLRTSAILGEKDPAKFILKHVIQEANEFNFLLYDDFEGEIINRKTDECLNKSLYGFFHQISLYKHDPDKTDEFKVNEHVPTIPLLILDQFEEVFSAPVSSSKEEFINELASLVENYPLHRNWNKDVSNELPNCKILVSIKSEAIPKLGKLSGIIPGISYTRNKIMLDRLTDSQGKYIINQLGNEQGTLSKFPKETINHIINEIASFDDLGNLEKRKVQPYFMSLYCHEVYTDVINRKKKESIRVADLKDDTKLLKRYYNENTKYNISKSTRRFVERNLLNNGSRALFPKANLPKKHESGFQSLERRKILHLLNYGDKQYYEIAHDKLAAIIHENHKKNEAVRKAKRSIFTVLISIICIVVAVAFWEKDRLINLLETRLHRSERELYEKESYELISKSSKEEGNWFASLSVNQQDTVVKSLIAKPEDKRDMLKRSYMAAVNARLAAEQQNYNLAVQLLKAARDIDKNVITDSIGEDSVFDRIAIPVQEFKLDGEGYLVSFRDSTNIWVVTNNTMSVLNQENGKIEVKNQEEEEVEEFDGNPNTQIEFVEMENDEVMAIVINDFEFKKFKNIKIMESVMSGVLNLRPSAIETYSNELVFVGNYDGRVNYYTPDEFNSIGITGKSLEDIEFGNKVISIAACKRYVAVSWVNGVIKIYSRDDEGNFSGPAADYIKLEKTEPSFDMIFTRDDKLFYGSDDNKAYLHKIGGASNVVFSGHTGYVRAVDYDSEENLFMTASYDDTALIWNEEGEVRYTLRHGGDVYDGEFIGKDSIITVSKDKMLYYWQLVDLNEVENRTAELEKISSQVDTLSNDDLVKYGINNADPNDSGANSQPAED